MKTAFFLFITVFSFALGLSPSAHAGAWTREEGELFIAFGGNFLLSEGARLPVHYDPTLYAEYGWDGHITIGSELYTADAGRIVAGLVFASFPLGRTDQRDKFAAQIALGAKLKQGNPPETVLRGGLSWGRSLNVGWISVDAYAAVGTNNRVFRGKIDATWGQHWTDDWSTSLQLQAGQGDFGDVYAKIVPTVIYRVRPNIVVNFGAVQALTGDKGSALKLETWFTF